MKRDASKLLTCAEFRVKRDVYQSERRKAALPLLKEQLNALNAKIEPLQLKWKKADKHHKTAVEYDLKPLWFDKQYVQSQIVMIEG